MSEFVDLYDRNRKLLNRVVDRSTYVFQPGEFMMYVLAILENEEGKFLVTQRALDKKWAAGGWEMPGGGAKSEESSLDAIKREVKEETGLDIKDLKLVGVNNNVSPNFNRYLVFLFKTKTFSGELKSSEEGKVFWVEKKNLRNYKLTPEFSDLIEIFYNDSINENYAVWDDKGEVKDHLL